MANNALVPLVKLTAEQIKAEATVDRYFDILEDTRDAVLVLIKTKVWESFNLKRDDYFWQRFGKTWKAIQRHQGTANKTICETKTIEQGSSEQLAATKPFAATPTPYFPPIDPDIDALLPDTPDEAKVKADTAKKAEKKVEKAQDKGLLDAAGHAVPSYLTEVFLNRAKWMDLHSEARNLGIAIGSQSRLMGGEECARCNSLLSVKFGDNRQVEKVSCNVLNEVAFNIENNAPYSVCPLCNGTSCLEETNFCISCNNRGWLSKYQWDGSPHREEVA